MARDHNGLGMRCTYLPVESPEPDIETLRRMHMWNKPEFTEMRFGFEVTMYIYNR